MADTETTFYRFTPLIVIAVALLVAGAGWWGWQDLPHHTQQGTEALERGDSLGAIGHFSRAQQLCETDIWARYHLGVAYQRYGWQDEALEEFDTTWQLATRLGVRAQEQAGRIFLARGELDQAAQRFEQGLALQPEAAPLWSLLGQVRRRQGDPIEAERCLAEAVRREPRNEAYRQALLRVALENRQAAQPAEDQPALPIEPSP